MENERKLQMEDKNEASWIQNDEHDWLMNLVGHFQGDVVELGTFRGGTTFGLRQHMSDNWVLWSIDNYTDPEFVEKFEDYNPLVIRNKFFKDCNDVFLVVGDSLSIGFNWSNPIGILFMDACHNYKPTLDNFNVWSKYVIFGGMVIMHDNHPDHLGVVQALNVIEKMGAWEVVSRCNTMVMLKRVCDNYFIGVDRI
jgi:hypothetical protein